MEKKIRMKYGDEIMRLTFSFGMEKGGRYSRVEISRISNPEFSSTACCFDRYVKIHSAVQCFSVVLVREGREVSEENK